MSLLFVLTMETDPRTLVTWSVIRRSTMAADLHTFRANFVSFTRVFTQLSDSFITLLIMRTRLSGSLSVSLWLLIMNTVALFLKKRSIGLKSFQRSLYILLQIEWPERNFGSSTVNLLSFEMVTFFVERVHSKVVIHLNCCKSLINGGKVVQCSRK